MSFTNGVFFVLCERVCACVCWRHFYGWAVFIFRERNENTTMWSSYLVIGLFCVYARWLEMRIDKILWNVQQRSVIETQPPLFSRYCHSKQYTTPIENSYTTWKSWETQIVQAKWSFYAVIHVNEMTFLKNQSQTMMDDIQVECRLEKKTHSHYTWQQEFIIWSLNEPFFTIWMHSFAIHSLKLPACAYVSNLYECTLHSAHTHMDATNKSI